MIAPFRDSPRWLMACWPCLALSAAALHAQLPDENTLPGQEPPAIRLPDENVLPKQFPIDAPRPDNDPSLAELPDENMLPASVRQAPPAAAGDEDEAADRPWLRLNYPGHTGEVRAVTFTADSRRLCTAGEDKEVHVWARPGLLGDEQWTHERAIRWQVQRGARGRIYALAARDDLLAVAGHGAMGWLGEILLVDPATGDLRASLTHEDIGHRQVVADLAFHRREDETSALLSCDVRGQTVEWAQDPETRLWRPRELTPPDEIRYGADVAKTLQPLRRSAPVAPLGDGVVVISKYGGMQQTSQGQLAVWSLERIDLATGRRRPLAAGGAHYDMVMAMAASPDGRRFASSDARGNLFLWERGRAAMQRMSQRAAVVSLSFSPDGRWLLAGTAESPALGGKALLQLWDVADMAAPRNVAERRLDRHVYACAISPDARWFAYGQGSRVRVGRLATPRDATQALDAPIRPPLRVAFSLEPPFYRIAFGTARDEQGAVPLAQTFDAGKLQLGGPAEAADKWIDGSLWRGAWRLETERVGATERYWLSRNGQRMARLPLRPEFHGAPTAACWIPDRTGQPYAVAVGTDGRNDIRVFRLAESGACEVLRQFRGHGGRVNSLSVSRDLRYLVSAADDATIRFWALRDFAADEPLLQRWGVGLVIDDGVLTVASIREDGPLFFRGVRQGDTLRRLELAGRPPIDDPQQMFDALKTTDWDALVVFHYDRGRVAQPAFQMFPSWQQVVSLFVSGDREWAYWTPAGYYDASFEGHKLFGWQVNRGLQLPPEFFLAAQFRRRLERPAAMSRLLEAGSLEEAFRAARLDPPVHAEDDLAALHRLGPRIEILSPTADQEIDADRVEVTASIFVPGGQALASPKAFASGVVASPGRLVSQEQVDGGTRYRYAWTALLPNDPRILIQVAASTDTETAAIESVAMRRKISGQPASGKLHVFAVGVDRYQDAQIQRLDFATRNARQFAAALNRQPDSRATLLLDEHATRPLWNVVARDQAIALGDEVSPDDLVVVFLSGHGVKDPATGQYYFVTKDAKYADLMAGRYDDCISFADFDVFGRLACRKLVILDTCHSGQVDHSLGQQNLKSALRALQDDMIFTLTASEGAEEAAESRDHRLGLFTHHLLEALSGRADAAPFGNADGAVTLAEAGSYVQSLVATNSRPPQHPTAGPRELLPYADVPLTFTAVGTRTTPSGNVSSRILQRSRR